MSHSVRHFAGDLYANAGIWSPPSSAAKYVFKKEQKPKFEFRLADH
jgi:hypothetical protein